MKIIKCIPLSKYHNPTQLVVVVLCLCIIVFSITTFVYSGIIRGLYIPIDFYHFYTAGQVWNEGLSPYDYELHRSRLSELTPEEELRKHPHDAYYYLPHITVLFSLLARLPLETAHRTLMAINISLIIISLCQLALILSWYRPVGLNDPSPFFPYSAYLLNLTPLVYRIFNVQSTITSIISWLTLFILYGYIAYLIRRSGTYQKADLLDFGLVSVLSVLSFYHRFYDIFLLFPGILYLYIHTLNTRNKNTRQKWAVFLVIILLLISIPGNLIELLVQLLSGEQVLPDIYLIKLIAPFPTWASIAICITLLWLKAQQVRKKDQYQVMETALS